VKEIKYLSALISLRQTFVLILFLFGQFSSQAQSDSTSFDRKKLKWVIGGTSLVYAGTLYSLNQLWYADYDRSKFNYFNDNAQWNQMDKVGHLYSSYLGGAIGFHALKFARVSDKKAAVYGGSLGFLFLSTVEVFDGYSQEWGFSWGDILFNGLGSGLFIGQQLILGEQVILPKYSFSSSDYQKIRPEILGETNSEAYLKDYNGQTYWLSFNLNSIYSKVKPTWLNFAIGYGANGMVSSKGDYVFNSKIISPYRQYYAALDIDLTKIKTNSKLLKSLLKAGNFIKFPSPTFEVNQGRESKFYWLFF
jgi:uncharacterized protein YfiM (DUF2279 family)